MANNSNQRDPKKYSNVVKSVKGSTPQQPEEPKITKEQVIAAFHSFGFEPNERNHNDIGYWTMKGVSEGARLMEELHKRRMEINKAEDDDNRTQEEKRRAQEKADEDGRMAKSALPRLSDQEIAALYDEYGLPAPDPEWSRNHLPNDPKKIRSILEMQRKMADDMLKKHTKNTVNQIPEVPKASAMPAPMPMATPAMPMGGMGGPLSLQGAMAGEVSPAKPFFVGDHSIVRITNPNNPNVSTMWLIDTKKKVLRPFMSDKAFQNAFESPEEAQKAVVTISTKELGPGGTLDGFKPLQGSQGVKDDGTMDEIEFSPAQIQRRYGKQSDSNAENKALSMLDGVFGNLNKASNQKTI